VTAISTQIQGVNRYNITGICPKTRALAVKDAIPSNKAKIARSVDNLDAFESNIIYLVKP
jgi:hypothetical protein